MEIDRERHEDLTHYSMDALVACLIEGRQDDAGLRADVWTDGVAGRVPKP